ncbi:MAG TPA: asparagine synthase-related protein [Candidatus Acidoferrales bacterium]|nr:asparagine synthase-related protein [Candidatus Acidoferrales bacterium]
MSGIAGILNLDGAPVDRDLLNQMARFMAFRGPDAQDCWNNGPVGLAHAMLRTTRESRQERQPISLDGEAWITADVRVDARSELIEKLQTKSVHRIGEATDAELILHAWRTWGEECTSHLLGDFAFGIWDNKKQILFCARDHFGVKPFFYARAGNCLIFSNTLNCIRIHPQVSDNLNDLAIGDFLVASFNQEHDTTFFSDIQRLPAAHTLTVSAGQIRVSRYWTLPVDKETRYKQASDYTEHFQELLSAAVSDRLRTDHVVSLMTGGLDSTTITATANQILKKQSEPFDLRAHCVVYDRLFPDEERHYSTLAAEALHIPIQHQIGDDYEFYSCRTERGSPTPEPTDDPLHAIVRDAFFQIASHSRVALTGEGGDSGLTMSISSHLLRLAWKFRFGRLANDFGRYLLSEGRLSRLYFRRRLGILAWKVQKPDLLPTWLNPEFEAHWNLRERSQQTTTNAAAIGSDRPEAYAELTGRWASLFEAYDPGITTFPVEVRHPFFDLRLMRFLISLPALPWCADKTLIREAMRGILPDSVRLRPKVPLAGDAVIEILKRPDSQWVDRFEPEARLHKYVDRNKIPAVVGERNSLQQWVNLRPLSLNLWLQSLAPMGYKRSAGGTV